MSTSASGAIKSYYLNSNKFEIKYLHTYKYSEDTVKLLEKNILYFELYKKDKFLTNIRPYTYPQICFFSCSSKYNATSSETSHEYSEHIYVFME
jgi:hypothetical protein